MIYFNLFKLLDGLEPERPGIKDRIWNWMKDEFDVTFKPYNGRISFINLFYYGIGDEYTTKYLSKYPKELEHSKSIHPDAFKDYLYNGSGDPDKIELRLDLNFIISSYDEYINDNNMESFPVIVKW